MAYLGKLSLYSAFIFSLFSLLSYFLVLRGKNNLILWSRRFFYLASASIFLAVVSLMYLILSHNFQVAYVYNYSSTDLPLHYLIATFWGGQEGTFLLWIFFGAIFGTILTKKSGIFEKGNLFFFNLIQLGVLLILLKRSPFVLLPDVPTEGVGLNPLLQNYWMTIHPVVMFVGFASTGVPFVFALSALLLKEYDSWLNYVFPWAIFSFLALGTALTMGGFWAYEVLGWGGYWGWDPVEIAAFMPWLTGTAFLHSVMIQEKRGMLKHWNMVLVILTYCLVIFGTFLTRSGVLSSVHAFAQSAIGPAFFGFIGLSFAASLALLLSRWNELRGENQLTSLLSRENLFLLNNLLFVSILVACFWGVIFPLISELFTGQKVTVGPPFYERTTGPMFAGLLLLMGIAPLSAWGRTAGRSLGRLIVWPLAASLVVPLGLALSGTHNPAALLGFWLAAFVTLVTLSEFWRGALARRRIYKEALPVALWNLAGRNRRRYGGYIIHLGVVLMAIGIIGVELYQQETQGTLAEGQQITLGKYVMTYDSLAEFNAPDDRLVARAVTTIYRDGQKVAELYPRRDFYYVSQQPMTIPGVYSSLEGDFYVLLVGWEPIGSSGATFKIYLNPLINFLWGGSLVFILGTLVAAWPDRERARATARVPAGALAQRAK